MSKTTSNLDSVETYHEVRFIEGVSGDPALECMVINVFRKCFELWCERHRKYGRSNIAKFGELGCLIRASDKIERLINLLFNNQGADVEDEAVEDSWLDMANYAVIAILCRRGKWPR